MIAQMACPSCFETGCGLSETKRLGLNSLLEIKCDSCGNSITSNTSPLVGAGKAKTAESNLMMVAGAKNCGMGHEKCVKFFGALNVPQPIHLKTFQSLAERVHEAAMTAASDCMVLAREKARTVSIVPQSDIGMPITVSYDGTWHKRGHSSHYGIGVIIHLETGFVIDFQVLSNHCHGCGIGPSRDDPGYEQWAGKHSCQRNYEGSANSMEVAAARILFPRSLDSSLVYSTIICDGDSKTVASLNQLDPYNLEIIKEDCVNHVAKRMWHAIDKIRSAKKLGGQKGITLDTRDLLAKYYACALKDNAPDVEKMKNGVYASLFHMVSTDDDPHHSYCPEGSTSWCFFQRARALGEPHRKHTPTLTRAVAEELLPAYKRLSDAALLERCARMQTQNANECFNGQVWRRCPKTEAASLRSVETATAMAVLEFNGGPEAFHMVLDKLGISPGAFQVERSSKACDKRLKRAAASSKDSQIRKRKKQKLVRAHKHNDQVATEGVTYLAGAFNN